MNETTRIEKLFEAFATLADTLVAGYDVLDLLQALVEYCHDLLDVDSERWPDFRATARAQGIHSVYAIPLRLRDTTIGTLNLMRTERGELNTHDVRAARALADVATIGILQERSIRDAAAIREQLQHALSSRIIIEQAKGVVSETSKLSMDAAFGQIRDHARSRQLPLSVVARQLVAGELRL